MALTETSRIWIPVMSLMFVAGQAGAVSSNDFECFADQPSDEICVVSPSESPTTLPTVSKSAPSVAKIPQMISTREVTGQAADQPYFLGDADSSEYTPSYRMEAMAASYRTLEDLRWIETFLKTGPSALSDDIRVQPASRRTAKP